MKKDNGGYTGLILSVLVILGFIIYAWSQLADRQPVDDFVTEPSAGKPGKAPVRIRPRDKKQIDAIGRRGSGKVVEAKGPGPRAARKQDETKAQDLPKGTGSAIDRVSELAALAGDHSYSIARRLELVKQVRLQHGSAEARSREVERQLLELIEHDESPEFKSGVIRLMKGMHSEALVQPLAQRAATDDNATVRKAALRTLMEYRNNKEVRQTLESIVQNDPDPECQTKAREILDMRR